MLYNMKEQTIGVSGRRASWVFHDGDPHYTETSPANQWTGFYTNLCHERVHALRLACIHWDTFLDFDKIIDIYASKYHRRMLLINPLSKT